MNGIKYKQLLEEKLELHMDIHRTSIFMHDKAPCHQSKVVKKFLSQKRIKVLDWPGNSPHLNPIENLWTVLKDKVAEKQPSSVEDLNTVIKEVWTQHLTPNFCSSLVDSMPCRMNAVIDSKGGPTNY